MTRLAIISDLHVNHWIDDATLEQKIEFVTDILDRIRANYEGIDRIIIAGDLWNGSSNQSYDFGSDVLYVNGNHDYYFRDFPEDDRIKIDLVNGTIISAATLWTNFWDIKDGREIQIFAGINDKYHIKDSSAEKLRVSFERTWKVLREVDSNVVVTHYPPSMGSISDQYWGNPYNPYFVNDKADELKRNPGNTRLWICGHVHHLHHYYIDKLLVVCNPLGYPGENYYDFNDYAPLIVENDENGGWSVVYD